MKLSMWILEKWLSDYFPVVTITEGRQTIEGVRLFTDEVIQNTRYAYISRVRDVMPGSESGEVLIIHRNDIISLKSKDLEEIFNSILEAFEFYNDWEIRLQKAVASSTPEQDLIDACEGVFGPMFMMDMSLNLIAYSKGFELGKVNSFWDEYIRFHNPSLHTIRYMKQSVFVKLMHQIHECQVFEEPHAAPYSNGIMLSYLSDGGELLGQLSISSNAPITQRDLQLARCIGGILDEVRFNTVKGSPNSHAEGIFYSAITKNEVDEYEMSKLLILQDWAEGDTFCIVKTMAVEPGEDVLSACRSLIAGFLPESILVIQGSMIVCIVRTECGDALLQTLLEAAAKTDMRFGMSNTFTNLMEISERAKQSLEALKHAARQGVGACGFHRCGLHAITHSDEREYVMCSLHPFVHLLREYDLENKTDYAATLRVFLQNERSVLLAAQDLFLHRNTVLYRINRIRAITRVDLNDPYEREYILTSFRILD